MACHNKEKRGKDRRETKTYGDKCWTSDRTIVSEPEISEMESRVEELKNTVKWTIVKDWESENKTGDKEKKTTGRMRKNEANTWNLQSDSMIMKKNIV